MGRSIRICFLFYCTTLFQYLFAGELPLVQSNNKSDIFLNKFFQSAHTDSTIQWLDSAIFYAKKEENTDVYIESLVEKALAYERAQMGDSSSYYYELSIKEARKTPPSTLVLAKAYKQYGHILGQRNNYFPALNYLDTASTLFLSVGDTLAYADVESMKGAVYDNSGNESKALESYLEASHIYERYQDSIVFAGIINNVAIVYKKIGDLDGALEYYDKSVDINNGLKDTVGLAVTKVNRGMLYKDLDLLDQALQDVNEALKVFMEKQMSYGAAIAHHNLAEIHLTLQNLDSVLYHVDESQKIATDLKYWLTVVGNSIVLSRALQDLGRPELAIKTALKAYDMSLEHGLLERQKEITTLLASNYEKVEDFESALKYYKKYKLVEDSLLSKESQEQINKLRTEYDLQQKDGDIKSLELINSYQRTLTATEHKWKYFLLVSFILSAIFVLLYFFLYKRQKRFSGELADQKAKLTDLNKEKDDLIAMVAHDLRSPLNNIKGLLGIIKDAQGADHGRMIELATQSTDVLRARINQILDIEAINVGKINLKISNVKVSEILKQLTRHVSPEAEKKQITFFTHTNNGITCQADENYLLQVLENLCTNAIKFSKQQSEIYVRVSKKEGKVRFEVQDEGQGIREDEIEKLFTRYAKISTVPTENESSTGLGLPIVKKYVEAMGGSVWCESEEGKGSSFFVHLEAGSTESSGI